MKFLNAFLLAVLCLSLYVSAAPNFFDDIGRGLGVIGGRTSNGVSESTKKVEKGIRKIKSNIGYTVKRATDGFYYAVDSSGKVLGRVGRKVAAPFKAFHDAAVQGWNDGLEDPKTPNVPASTTTTNQH